MMNELDETFEELKKYVKKTMEADGLDYDIQHKVFQTALTMKDALLIITDGGSCGIVGEPVKVVSIWATLTLQILCQYKGEDRNDIWNMLKTSFETIEEVKDLSLEEMADELEKKAHPDKMSNEEIKDKLQYLTEQLKKLEEKQQGNSIEKEDE